MMTREQEAQGKRLYPAMTRWIEEEEQRLEALRRPMSEATRLQVLYPSMFHQQAFRPKEIKR